MVVSEEVQQKEKVKRKKTVLSSELCVLFFFMKIRIARLRSDRLDVDVAMNTNIERSRRHDCLLAQPQSIPLNSFAGFFL